MHPSPCASFGPRAALQPGEQPAIAIFTICTAGYLARANVLAESLAALHEGQRLTLFLIGTLPPGVMVAAVIDLLPADRALPAAEFRDRQAFYSVLELATSIKPACFRYLFGQGAASVTYLDPDIMFLAPLPGLLERDGPPLMLTPHCLTPLPEDGRHPNDLGILRAGTYNLGFAQFRASEATDAFLAWWDRRLHRQCLEDQSSGSFTDQRWMDFAPVLLPGTEVLRHPGCNAAYWNLHERTLVQRGDTWHVERHPNALQPLVFFHFSGFIPGQPGISRYESRFGTRPPGATGRLFEDYAIRLAAAGQSACDALPPFRASLTSGEGWDPVLRWLYRHALERGLALGDPLAEDGLLHWARQTEPDDPLPRYLRALLMLRPQLADQGLDRAGLLDWARTTGQVALGIDPAMLRRLGLDSHAPAAVHLAGYITAHLGLGEAARNTIAALQQAGIAVQGHDLTPMINSPTGPYPLHALPPGAVQPRISILGCNADELPNAMRFLPQSLATTYRIGCWYWETPDFPEAWCDRFDLVDEVWVPTRFIAETLRAKALVPVVVMPMLVQVPPMAADHAWLRQLVPELAAGEFVFFFQCDVHSEPFRKNPEGTILAFTAAFRPDEPVRLLIKLLNGAADPTLMPRLQALAGAHRVSFLDLALDSGDRFRLMASIDCFVSLHRAEGFGLSIAEAMAYARPVVTTNWSGNTDFTDATTAALVGHDPIRTDRAHGPYPAGTLWAEPRLAEAAAQMRRMVDDPAWRAAIAAAGAARIAEQFSPRVVGEAMRARLTRIGASRRSRAPTAMANPYHQRPPAQAACFSDILRDVLTYPGYYGSRLPRLPRLLRAHALGGLAVRLGETTLLSTQYKAAFGIKARLAALRRALAHRRLQWMQRELQ